MRHGLAFAPRGWTHAPTSSLAFARLRANTRLATPGSAIATATFDDGSVLLGSGSGANAHIFPWPLIPDGGTTLQPDDAQALVDLHAQGYSYEDLWWHDASMLRPDGYHRSSDVLRSLMILIGAAGLGRERIIINVHGSTPSAPGWNPVDPAITVPCKTATVQAAVDALCAWITPLLFPDPTVVVGRKWTHTNGQWERTSSVVIQSSGMLETVPSQHDALRAAGHIRSVLGGTAPASLERPA